MGISFPSGDWQVEPKERYERRGDRSFLQTHINKGPGTEIFGKPLSLVEQKAKTSKKKQQTPLGLWPRYHAV